MLNYLWAAMILIGVVTGMCTGIWQKFQKVLWRLQKKL